MRVKHIPADARTVFVSGDDDATRHGEIQRGNGGADGLIGQRG